MLPEKPTASSANTGGNWRQYVDSYLANEISRLTRYCDRVIDYLPMSDVGGKFFDLIEAKQKQVILNQEDFPDLSSERTDRTVVLIRGRLNHHYDIQDLFLNLHASLPRSARLLIVLYNPYLRWLYGLANCLKLRRGPLPTTFLTEAALNNLAAISKFQLVRKRLLIHCPWRLFGLGNWINRILPCVPVIRWLSLIYIAVLRPLKGEDPLNPPSISCIIPARNERGNIEEALRTLPDLGCDQEVIFVEGHSTDGTWEEIQRVAQVHGHKLRIKCFQQRGKGKGDAVRLGFSQAEGDLLVILDADLSMPPALLGRFYSAYCSGDADFVNGSRLVYPMEGKSMRFLNLLGNIFFAKALSWTLDMQLSDSLCGTKLLTRRDYQRMVAWREDFGDVDPFGDFELLFPAAQLGLGVIDIPIRYRARTYGDTNISRYRHGLLLFKMTLIGFVRIKLGIGSSFK
jgi:hypothetical protein